MLFLKRKKTSFKIKRYSKVSHKGKCFIEISRQFFLFSIQNLYRVPKKCIKGVYYWNRLNLKKIIEVGNNKVLLNYNKRFIKNKNKSSYVFLSKRKFVKNVYSYPCLISLDYAKLYKGQLESLRRFLKNRFSKKVFIYKRIFTFRDIYHKALQMRMGKGKGNKYYDSYYPVYPGCKIIEIRGKVRKFGFNVLKESMKKLGFRTKVFLLERI